MSNHSRSIRALAILEFVADSHQPVRIADVAARCGLPKATAHRLCRLLRTEGYLSNHPTGRGLVPGIRLRRLGQAALANGVDYSVRQALLERLAREVGESCSFVVPDGTQMMCLNQGVASSPLQLSFDPHMRIPMHCTATGKLYLSSLPSRRRRQMLRHLPLDRFTPATITDLDALEAALRVVEATGVGTSNGEYLKGMVAIAVQVRTPEGQFLGCLSLQAAQSRLTLEEALSHQETLRWAARELAQIISAETAPEPEPILASAPMALARL